MSFFKFVFWAALVLLILPSNGEQRLAIYTNTQKTLQDIAGFCTRNPDVCNNVVSAFQGIGQKLSATATMVETMLYQAGVGADPALTRVNQGGFDPAGTPETTSSTTADTLTSHDLQPPWRGPASD